MPSRRNGPVSSNVRHQRSDVWCSSRNCAGRRVFNSHYAAKPRIATHGQERLLRPPLRPAATDDLLDHASGLPDDGPAGFHLLDALAPMRGLISRAADAEHCASARTSEATTAILI